VTAVPPPLPLDPTQPVTLVMIRTAALTISDVVMAPATRRSALFDLEHALATQVNAHLDLGARNHTM